MNVLIEEKWYSIGMLSENLKHLYIFGDNTMCIGNGGQAQIRDCYNSMGVATKRAPAMTDDAFFGDTEKDYINLLNDLVRLSMLLKNPLYDDWTLVFPIDGLGTGLSQMPLRSPFLTVMLANYLKQYFGVNTAEDGRLSIA